MTAPMLAVVVGEWHVDGGVVAAPRLVVGGGAMTAPRLAVGLIRRTAMKTFLPFSGIQG